MKKCFIIDNPGITRVPVLKKVVYLPSLDKAEDTQRTVQALLDSSDPVLSRIAKTIQIKNKDKREKALKILQKHCDYSDLCQVAAVLDGRGCKYERRYQIVDWKYARVLYRARTRE